MPTAILRTPTTDKRGNSKDRDKTVTVTHNNARLLFTGGRTYEYIGNDASGNRIYRDTSPRQ